MKNLIPLCLVLLATITARAGETVIPIPNADFESSDPGGVPSRWQILDASATPYELNVHLESPHTGDRCVEILHVDGGRRTLVSESVSLRVGHLYRLSGWIRTEQACADPTDRYPTSVPACLTMESFPITNHSPAVGATSDWRKVETLFIATKSTDRVRLHFGFNGNARGRVWFDDIRLEKVEDITQYIPMETVKWCDEGFRYDDRGWIFLHIEGDAYQRGYQHGFLLAEEIEAYISKLAVQANEKDPAHGWENTRLMVDGMMFRKYETEFLEEMQGIADGAKRAGAGYDGRPLNLLDIVTVNSVIDLRQIPGGLARTAHALTGRNFMKAEDELDIPEEQHKCSGFLANGPASADGRIVYGQIFMWSGYTGPHWNVICDLDPADGHRLVYETFPGGIHSGADFYINEAGIMLGETTVRQTPFDLDGTPQSNRIRKAAQYASSIDEAVDILSHQNNGMYTNDWLMGDTKTDEIAIFLLGTKKSRLWRSRKKDFPADFEGFYWSNNNNKDPEVCKEYIPNADNAPYDLIFTPWNRDVAFNEFYKKHRGSIDAVAGTNLWNSAPINRPHACDGKITTSEMAEQLVFLAHSGKVTLREKFVGENGRIPDLPGAEPRLSLGYSVASPVFVTDKLKAHRDFLAENHRSHAQGHDSNITAVEEMMTFDGRDLWFNTVYPASEAVNWFVSGTAAYWEILHNIPETTAEACAYFQDEMASVDAQLSYTLSREGSLAPLKTERRYDLYKFYRIPRFRGTFLLHQLRLFLGNETFSRLMNGVHDRYREKEMSTNDFIAMAERIAGKTLRPFILQWLEREDLPSFTMDAARRKTEDGWIVEVAVHQEEKPYHAITTVVIETAREKIWHRIEIKDASEEYTFITDEAPVRVSFNPEHHIPTPLIDFYTLGSYYEDFHNTIVAYGTNRQIEANHTLALRFSTLLGDRVSERLPVVKKDCELTKEDFLSSDLILLGGLTESDVVARVSEELGLHLGVNHFRWMGKTYADSDDGLFAAFPNPQNPDKFVFLILANSALQLHKMTREYHRNVPSWAVFQEDRIVESGYHPVAAFTSELE